MGIGPGASSAGASPGAAPIGRKEPASAPAPPMERSRNLRISTSMPMSTAASRTSAPPNQRPHWAKRRTPFIVRSMCRYPSVTRDTLDSATSVSPLWRRRFQSEYLADGLVPFLGAFDAAAFGPIGQYCPSEQLFVRLVFLGLHRHNGRLRELAHSAGLLAGIAIVGLGIGRLDRGP